MNYELFSAKDVKTTFSRIINRGRCLLPLGNVNGKLRRAQYAMWLKRQQRRKASK